MTAFSLGTFGFPEVHADGRPIKLNLRKGLALLVYLAEAKGAVARDVVATLLWPETPPRDRPRRDCGGCFIASSLRSASRFSKTDRTSVRWSPAVELRIDSHLFESACDRGEFEEACQIYRGDFLGGLLSGRLPRIR